MKHRLPEVSMLTDRGVEPLFLEVYERFLARLRQLDPHVVAADHEFFIVHETSQEDLAKARLLGCLLHTDGSLLDEICRISLGFPRSDPRWQVWKAMARGEAPALSEDSLEEMFDGAPDPPTAVPLLVELERAIETPAWEIFGKGRTAPRVLLEFSYNLGGITCSDNPLACVALDSEWAIVLNWTLDVSSLPLLFGFVHRGDLARNLVTLSLGLGHVPLISGHFEFDTRNSYLDLVHVRIPISELDVATRVRKGDRLLFACLGHEQPPALLELLMQLTPAERDELAASDFRRLDRFASRIAKLMDFDRDFFEQFGRPRSADDLDAIATALERAAHPVALDRLEESAKRESASRADLQELAKGPSPSDAEIAARLLLHFGRLVSHGERWPFGQQGEQEFLTWCLSGVGEQAVERARALDASLSERLAAHVRSRLAERQASRDTAFFGHHFLERWLEIAELFGL